MKLLLLFPLFFLSACLGTSPAVEREVRASADGPRLDCPLTECPGTDCHVSVERTPRGTCLLTCRDANDEIVCQEEITCDEPCDKPCESPCPMPCEKDGMARSCPRQ